MLRLSSKRADETLTRNGDGGQQSFTEGRRCGGSQPAEAISNILRCITPTVIHSHYPACRTIGDDIVQIAPKRGRKASPAGKYLIHANTPSYIWSQ